MIWIPLPNAWPICAKCKTPVERLTEIVARPDIERFVCFVECHGEREQMEFSGPGQVRRVHFVYGVEVFLPKADVRPARRQIDL